MVRWVRKRMGNQTQLKNSDTTRRSRIYTPVVDAQRSWQTGPPQKRPRHSFIAPALSTSARYSRGPPFLCLIHTLSVVYFLLCIPPQYPHCDRSRRYMYNSWVSGVLTRCAVTAGPRMSLRATVAGAIASDVQQYILYGIQQFARTTSSENENIISININS
jgi:hypothetical protein